MRLWNYKMFPKFYFSTTIPNKFSLFKLTISGFDKQQNIEDVSLKLKHINEIEVVKISKELKKNYCHVSVKSFLDLEQIKAKFENIKLSNKKLKIRVKALDEAIDSIDEELLLQNSSYDFFELNSLIKYIDRIKAKQTFISNTKEGIIDYLSEISSYFNTISSDAYFQQLNSNYIELEWSCIHINNISENLIINKSDKRLFRLFEVKSYSKLKSNSPDSNDKMSQPYENYLNIAIKVKSSFEFLITALNFSPYLDDNYTIWKGIKLQIFREHVLITICLSLEKLWFQDLAILKKSILIKFSGLISNSTKVFLAVNEKKSSKISDSQKYLDLNDISISKSEITPEEVNSRSYQVIPWLPRNSILGNISISQYFDLKNLDSVYLYDPNCYYPEKISLSEFLEIQIIHPKQVLSSYLIDQSKLFIVKNKVQIEDSVGKSLLIPKVLPEILSNNLLIINVNSMLKDKITFTALKPAIINSKYFLLFSSSMPELLDFIKFFYLRNLSISILSIKVLRDEVLDSSIFIIALKRND